MFWISWFDGTNENHENWNSTKKINLQYNIWDTNTRSQVQLISNNNGMEPGNLHLKVRAMMLNATVVSVIGGGNRSTRRKPPTCHKSLTNFIIYCCIEYISPWVEFEFITLVVLAFEHPDPWSSKILKKNTKGINTRKYPARKAFPPVLYQIQINLTLKNRITLSCLYLILRVDSNMTSLYCWWCKG